VAKRLVRYLDKAGYVVMKKPPLGEHDQVDRSVPNQISLDLTGTVTDTHLTLSGSTPGLFQDTPANAVLTFFADPNNPGQIGEWSFTDFAATPPIDHATPTPELSTFGMLITGFASMVWFAKRKTNRLDVNI
jgi:hypothetical protein